MKFPRVLTSTRPLAVAFFLLALALSGQAAQAISCWKLVNWTPNPGGSMAQLIPASCTTTPAGYVWLKVQYGYPPVPDIWLLLPANNWFLNSSGDLFYAGMEADGTTPKIQIAYIVGSGGGGHFPTTTPPVRGGRPRSIRPRINVNLPMGTARLACGIDVNLAGQRPEGFYTGERNPWGVPAVVEDSAKPGVWSLQFGGPPESLCLSADDFPFRAGGVRFGFDSPDGILTFLGSSTGHVACSLLGPDGDSVPCPGMTGHFADADHEIVEITNADVTAHEIRNLEVSVSESPIDIKDLDRATLEHLSWRPLSLSTSILPAASEGEPGVLVIPIVESLRSQGGYLVLSYDVVDPKTSALENSVTLSVPLQED